MKHHLRTTIGVSEGYIQYGKENKQIIKDGLILFISGIIGVGQGGRASPIIWMTILIILMRAYKKTQQGASIWNCVTNTAMFMFIISYVDDNLIVRHFQRNTTTAEIIREMKKIYANGRNCYSLLVVIYA